MNILQIIYSLSSGGAERFLTDLSNELIENDGCNVTVLILKSDKDINNIFYKAELSDKIKFISLGIENFNLSIFVKLYRLIRLEKPDIVHIHLSPIIIYCILPILFYRVPIYIETLHNEIARIENGNKLRNFLKGFIYKSGLIKICTISDKNTQEFERIYKRQSNALIYNGRRGLVQSNFYKSVNDEINNYKTNSNTLVITHIARCSKQKNQHLLIDSFNKIIEQGCNAILLVIGNGFDSNVGIELRNKSCGKIYFLGEKHNIQDYLLCSDAFCLSSFYEGMPITLIEALSCGCIPLSTPVSGVIDLITDGVNGFISKDFSLDSFVNMFKRYFQNRECIDKQLLIDLYENKLSIAACANTYYRFYKSCLNAYTR